jgi:hypothetical protein
MKNKCKMKLSELINITGLNSVTDVFEPDKEITGAYTSDLLSDVIANSKKDQIWITLQTHQNIVAVASLKEIAAIVIVMDKDIGADTLEKANSEKITILRTGLTAFQISGMIYESGIK